MNADKRVVIVTGAGGGLGRAYALELATRGMRVVVNNRRRELDAAGLGSAQRVVAEIERGGGEAIANDADACDPDSGLAMVRSALNQWGRLDAVVANAGVDQHQAFHRISVAEFTAIFEVNFFGTLRVVHAAYAQMRSQRHGRIVLSTSSAGLHGLHGLTSYAAAKAALIGLMRSVSAEGRSHDVLCNAIAPYAATRMTDKHADPEFRRSMQPQHVAALVGLLLSPQCTVTGRTIVAGGGGFRLAEMMEEQGMHALPAAAAIAGDTQQSLLAALQAPLLPANAQTFPDALAAFADFTASLRHSEAIERQ